MHIEREKYRPEGRVGWGNDWVGVRQGERRAVWGKGRRVKQGKDRKGWGLDRMGQQDMTVT